MSVRTTADEKIEDVRTLLKQAHVSLLEALNPDTWGSDDYTSERDEELMEILTDIVKIRKKL